MSREFRRTSLTLIAVTTAIFLFTTMQGILHALRLTPSVQEDARRFAVLERYGGPRTELPISYARLLERTGLVQAVSPLKFTILTPHERGNGPFYVTYGVDLHPYLRIFPDVAQGIRREAAACMDRERRGVLVGRRIMEAGSWSAGRTIRLHSMLHGIDLDLVICGTIRDLEGESTQTEAQMIVREDYLGERVGSPDKVHMFWIRLKGDADIANSLRRIGELASLSTHAVSIQTEGAILEQMSQFTGTIRWLVQVVSWMVLVTVWIVSTNTIAISTREKRRDVGLLKAIGFTPNRVMGWILAESVLLACSGGLIGTLLGWGFLRTRWVAEALGMVHAYRLTLGMLGVNAAAAVAIGGLSGWIPAWTAARWSVVKTIQG